MSDTRTIHSSDLLGREAYFLLNSVVLPRPIAWVASRTPAGVDNLAPHSFFTVACAAPPMILFTSIGAKDTVRNIAESGQFVVNIASAALVEQMNVTSADAPQSVSEFELAGLTPLPGDRVAAARVAEAPVAMECVNAQIIENGGGAAYVVMGEVVTFHIAESVFGEKDRVDPALLDAVGRMGASTYSYTRDRFDLRRPTYAELTEHEGD